MRGIALLTKVLAALALACAVASGARADGITVRDAKLVSVDGGLALDADFSFNLTPKLEEAVANGVPLYFVVDFELTRPRWWWFDERLASKRLQVRLAYHVLSRKYRLSTGQLQQSFATLDDALRVLQRVRNWLVVDRSVALASGDYDAAVRMRLDTTQLPKPFQINALTSGDWHLDSPWLRFTYRSAGPPPAPVESRQPTEGPSQ